jgi:hypothetical protein
MKLFLRCSKINKCEDKWIIVGLVLGLSNFEGFERFLK